MLNSSRYYAINPAYFLPPRIFSLDFSGTPLSRFIVLPDLNRFKLTKPLVLFTGIPTPSDGKILLFFTAESKDIYYGQYARCIDYKQHYEPGKVIISAGSP